MERQETTAPALGALGPGADDALTGTLQDLSDEDLACRTQAGSVEAFEELVTRYEKRIFNFLRHKTPDRQDAEDLTQTAFVLAYRKIRLYNPKYKFATWLFTIARHAAISHFRASRRPDPPPGPEADTRDPATILAEQDNRQSLWDQARACLPELQFTALWLMYAEDLSVRDIAEVMKQSVSYVKVMLHRARTRLAQVLPADPPCAQPATSQGGAR